MTEQHDRPDRDGDPGLRGGAALRRLLVRPAGVGGRGQHRRLRDAHRARRQPGPRASAAIDDHQPPSWPDDGRKQFHLDLAVDDLDAMAERAVELGATLADPQPGETWRVLIDPAGHPFCLTDAANWG